MSYFRANIDKMQGYVPGEQPKNGEFIKLNTNENPYPPSQKVLTAMQNAVNAGLRLYPDPLATAPREKIAALFKIKPGQIMLGNGSDDILSIIIRSFVGYKDKVVVPYPTYSLYETLIAFQDGELCNIDFNDDFSLPDGIAIEGAKVTFLSNPNSPSGTIIPPDAVSDLAKRIDGVLVIDEAYADFADTNCLDLVNKHDNVIVLRTLSKSYSLAGLRLGFGIAQENLITGMTKVKDSYNVDRICMAGVIAAMDDQEGMKANTGKIIRTRELLSERLEKWGFYVYPSQSNFVFARSPKGVNTKKLFAELTNRRILVRYFEKRKTDDCLRITIGTDAEIQKFLDNIADILGVS
ncbi:MAG: histidinol-phosphate transaminase [Candidatus Anammoxibacter sp.]